MSKLLEFLNGAVGHDILRTAEAQSPPFEVKEVVLVVKQEGEVVEQATVAFTGGVHGGTKIISYWSL